MKNSERTLAEVFPPGDFIQEELDAREWIQADFARILGVDKKSVSDVVTGKRSITPDMALLIGEAFGTGPAVWLNLDSEYQIYKAMREKPRGESVARRAKLYAEYPVREMVKRGWISDTANVDALEKELTAFTSPPRRLVARRVHDEEKLPLQVAWLARAFQLAQHLPAERYSEVALARALEALRPLLSTPEDLHRIPGILGGAGVRFVIVEHLPGSKIDGACFWLDNESPVVALSLRYDRIDNFWFTLMHEIGHAGYGHGREEAMLDSNLMERDPALEADEEVLANTMATEFLVPQAELDTFVLRTGPYYSAASIHGFSRRIGVHPGIVIGQLQRRKHIPYSAHRSALVKVRKRLNETSVLDGWGGVALPETGR